MIDPDKYEFPYCLHPVAAALHMLEINPAEMVIELPRADWWKLRCVLDAKFPYAHPFDGRGTLSDTFELMGVKFRARADK